MAAAAASSIGKALLPMIPGIVNGIAQGVSSISRRKTMRGRKWGTGKRRSINVNNLGFSRGYTDKYGKRNSSKFGKFQRPMVRGRRATRNIVAGSEPQWSQTGVAPVTVASESNASGPEQLVIKETEGMLNLKDTNIITRIKIYPTNSQFPKLATEATKFTMFKFNTLTWNYCSTCAATEAGVVCVAVAPTEDISNSVNDLTSFMALPLCGQNDC